MKPGALPGSGTARCPTHNRASGLVQIVESMKATPMKSPSFWHSGWAAYPLAVGLTLVTLCARLWIGGGLEGPVLILFTIPIITSAFLGGVGPGMLATLTAFLVASYYLLPPLNNFGVANSTDRWQQLILILAGTVISFICEALHRSHRRSKSNLAIFERAQDDLKASLKEADDLRTALDEHAIVALTDPRGKIGSGSI
jgi:K+-sensing histidine kinase KdpD